MAETDNMDETSADVLGFNRNPANTSNPMRLPYDEVGRFDRDSTYYDMSGDKYLIILNHHIFQTTVYFNNKQPLERNGTEQDVTSLTKLFKNFDFKIDCQYELLYDDIIKYFKEFASRDHSNTSCICVAILTHGDNGGILFAADRPYQLKDILTKFEGQPCFAGIPKLFFLQACRGGKTDPGVTHDSESVATIPTHADYLILCSTVEDYLSYRDSNGSWMIQALCKIISKHHKELDLLHMITLLNKKIAYDKLTYTPRQMEMHNKKQMPETRFTLTKQLKFLSSSRKPMKYFIRKRCELI